jgi:hypothetical protein
MPRTRPCNLSALNQIGTSCYNLFVVFVDSEVLSAGDTLCHYSNFAKLFPCLPLGLSVHVRLLRVTLPYSDSPRAGRSVMVASDIFGAAFTYRMDARKAAAAASFMGSDASRENSNGTMGFI